MKTFFTSDLHFGHEKVAEIRGFDSVEDHDVTIASHWAQTIDETDEVWVLGDIAKAHSEYALTLLTGLPGVKHLISGNHDRVHPSYPNSHKYLHRYLDVFETVQERVTLRMDGRKVVLSHFPFTADHSEKPRHMEWRVQDKGQWLIHGHVHSDRVITGPRQIHVGVDAWEFWPAPLHEVQQEMRIAAALYRPVETDA